MKNEFQAILKGKNIEIEIKITASSVDQAEKMFKKIETFDLWAFLMNLERGWYSNETDQKI